MAMEVFKVLKKVQKKLFFAKKPSFLDSREFENEVSGSLPRDVKEGHFAVIGVENGKPKRFVVPLGCLSHPTFCMLLDQAAEEFGFSHEGVVTIPCQWSELEGISCKL